MNASAIAAIWSRSVIRLRRARSVGRGARLSFGTKILDVAVTVVVVVARLINGAVTVVVVRTSTDVLGSVSEAMRVRTHRTNVNAV